MAKSKDPNTYPHTYWELVEAVSRGKAVTLTFDNRKAADAFRFDVYGFRNALRHVADPAAPKAAAMRMTVQPSPFSSIEKPEQYEVVCSSVIDLEINTKINAALGQTPLDSVSLGSPPQTEETTPQDADEHETTLGSLGYSVKQEK